METYRLADAGTRDAIAEKGAARPAWDTNIPPRLPATCEHKVWVRD